MISQTVTKILFCVYIILSCICLVERRPVTALYWFGASILNLGIILGMTK